MDYVDNNIGRINSAVIVSKPEMSFSVRRDIRSDTLKTREIFRRAVVSGDTNNAGFIAGTNELVEILAPSSSMMKSDIVVLEDVSEEFSRLKPVRYDIVHNGAHAKSDIGLIAEDVLPLFPEFVEYGCVSGRLNGEGKVVKGVSYDKLVVLCIQQIQQLKEQNSNLIARISALENAQGGIPNGHQ